MEITSNENDTATAAHTRWGETMETNTLVALFHIFIIDVVLSGDNAVVIGMACRGLSPIERKKAILYGTLGAIILRVLLTIVATWMLAIPLVKAVGGIMLLYISLKLLGGDEDTNEVQVSKSSGQAIKTIILADFIMSLDNVLAVGGAAGGDVILVVIGLALSIPLLMFGSNLIANLLERYPILLYVGTGILAYTAAHMFLEDPFVRERIASYLAIPNQAIAGIIVIVVLLLGKWRSNRI
ncbi:membrane protein [Brevibacillus laterosporus]|uniref:Membrane protein n=2 Tax=Brevibacillus laterosporus TaxID=1465 RepID=A0A0F7EGY3_BRELA|nr:membrane protein [Brevibacillus laterosporus]